MSQNSNACPRVDIGGQAVMEGVMMRSPDAIAIAVRRPDHSIVVKRSEYTPLSTDDDVISTNNTKDNATLIKENESVTGFLNVMGTDPADWYKFTVTGEIGILDVKCASWRGMESVLLKEDGSAVEGGENLTSDNSLELPPGTYYLGYKYIQTDDPSGGRTYTISFSQQSKLTGITMDPEEKKAGDHTDDEIPVENKAEQI